MRSKSSVGVLAVMLAVAAIGPGTTFAQTPVAPAPTVPAQPDDQSKGEKPTVKVPKVEKPTVEVPKVEKPTVEVPKLDKPTVEVPKVEKPTVEVPKVEKPTVEVPKVQKPAVKAPKPEKPTVKAPKPEKVAKPRDEKPTPDTSTPAQPSPAPSEPAHPEPAAPERGQAGAPRAQPDGPEPYVDVAKPVSPRRKSAPAVPVSDVPPVTSARGGAAEENRQVVRRRASPSGPEPSGTSAAGSSGDSADATPVAGAPAAATPRRAPRLGTDGVAGAAAAASLDPRQPRVLIVNDPGGYNLVPLLLAMVLAAGVGYLFGRQVMHGLGLAAPRPAPNRRGARPRPAARGRERVDRRFRERVLRTSARRPRARRRVPRRHPFLGRAGTAVVQFLWPSVRRKSSRRRRAGTESGFRTPSPVRPSR